MIAQTIGATLALWPRLGRVGLRPAAPGRAVNPKRCEMRRQQPHRWTFERKAWRCTLCSRVAKRRTQHNRPPPGKCPNEQNAEHHDRFQFEAQSHGHVTWEHSMGPLHSSIVCVAERMRDGACAVWLRSAKVVRPATTARGSAAVCSKGCIPKRERVWAREHQLTSSFTNVEVRWPLPTLWNSTRTVPIGCGAVKKGPVTCRCVLCSQTA